MISVLRSVLDNYTRFAARRRSKPPQRIQKLAVLSVLGNLVLALCAVPLFGQATGNTTIQPDCIIPFTFTAAGVFPLNPTNNGAGDNRQKGCAAWTLMYQNGTGMTSVSVTLESGSSPNTTVSFGAFAGTISMGYSNPIVSDTGGSLQATNGTADISWVRVNVAATGTGILNGVLYGFRNSSAAVNGGGGGGGGCPKGSIDGEVQLKAGAICGVDTAFVDYTAGIPDPTDAPTVTTSGTPGMTTYTYVIVEATGAGWTLASPTTTITTGNATLDGTNFNNITLPTVADANVYCLMVRTAGPGSIAVAAPVLCDGSVQQDNGISGTFTQSAAGLPGGNTTTGLTAPGLVGMSTNYKFNPSLGLLLNGGSAMPILTNSILAAVIDPLGNTASPTSALGTGTDNGFYAYLTFGTNGGFWQNVETANFAGSPFTTTSLRTGFVKCDTTAGNVSVVLPAASTFPFPTGTPYGRIITVHKPVAANSCTISTSDGTTIDGSATYVLTSQFASVTVYWDDDGDGNTPMWATSSRLSFDKVVGSISAANFPASGVPAPSAAFAGIGTPANGNILYCTDCTVTSGIDNTCVGSGSGAVAQRINGAWKCEQ